MRSALKVRLVPFAVPAVMISLVFWAANAPRAYTAPVIVVEDSTPLPDPTQSPRPEQSSGLSLELRSLILERPAPKMDWRVEQQNRFYTRFSGTLTGHGDVEISAYIFMLSSTGAQQARRVSSTTLKMPVNGGTKKFDFKVSTPPSFRAWRLEAKNKGTWKGFYDLKGCCAAGLLEADCLPDGRVLCGKKEISVRCRCK